MAKTIKTKDSIKVEPQFKSPKEGLEIFTGIIQASVKGNPKPKLKKKK